MARSDYSRYDDEPRRSQGGLSLSTAASTAVHWCHPFVFFLRQSPAQHPA